MVGYIDSDAHIVESDHTWDFFDPGEEHLKPIVSDGHWAIQDLYVPWPAPVLVTWMRDVFPAGAVDLSDPVARLRYMDELGVDVHVMYPTFWLVNDVASVMAEAAMARSYNRWLAERTADSGGRLRWAAHVPVRTMDRALEELEYSRDRGAVSVYVRGIVHGMGLNDPYLWPLYDKAQDLDLVISVHVGGDAREAARQRGLFLHSSIMPVLAGLNAVLLGGLRERFPRLRWSFLEAGASWLPFVLQETFRADDTGSLRSFNNWREGAKEAFLGHQLFVSCQMDDDIPYLAQLTGEDHLVHGTDFGHLDLGSDPNGLHIIATRSDLDPVMARKIVDENGRRLYGIDPRFQPAPTPTKSGYTRMSGGVVGV